MRTKKSIAGLCGALALFAMSLLAVAAAHAVVLTGGKDTPVDLALPLPQPTDGGLGTTKVEPDEEEKPYFDKLPADQQITGSFLAGYDLADRKGKYVGWYGIIRAIKEDAATSKTTLTLQHVYSDGATDLHIMTVSYNGSGDFTAVLNGTHLPLLPLRLVKVYGDVESYTDGKPSVSAVFVKEWDWGRFNFMDYGPDNRNPEWKAAGKVEGKKVYDPYPRAQHYRDRLGDAPSSLYDVMTQAQIFDYAGKIPSNQGIPDMAVQLAAPLYVGQVVQVKPEMRGAKMPAAIGFKQASEYVEFVKANHAHRAPEIEKDNLAMIEQDISVRVLKYALPEESVVAIYQVRPLTGQYKDQEWWLPGFVLSGSRSKEAGKSDSSK